MTYLGQLKLPALWLEWCKLRQVGSLLHLEQSCRVTSHSGQLNARMVAMFRSVSDSLTFCTLHRAVEKRADHIASLGHSHTCQKGSRKSQERWIFGSWDSFSLSWKAFGVSYMLKFKCSQDEIIVCFRRWNTQNYAPEECFTSRAAAHNGNRVYFVER